MVEVFKTNVHEAEESHRLRSLLLEHFPGCNISFDMEDCDRVLRIAGHTIITEKAISILLAEGYNCEPLS